MSYIADLHLHSCFSRATSKNANLEGYYEWAQIKGIELLGTGDFTHPQWYAELTEKLIPDGGGFFYLKNPPPSARKTGTVRFCLSAEISSIYKKAGATRKVHSLLFAPDLEIAARINTRLATLGNIRSDGRPILGLDPKVLLKIVKDISPEAQLIPAHIWTPWFALFGSKSGFDTIEDCFEELTSEIFALETGLSSDPLMNWRWSALDRFRLISNSDAHSPQKLGREANVFNTDFSYQGLFTALKTGVGFGGTIEFYPEEGKYHLDGHRKCQVCLEPEETLKAQGLCPVCGKPLTIGVMHRVIQLADRPQAQKPAGAPGFRYLIPLPEVLAEVMGAGAATQKVMEQYWKIIRLYKNEFTFLLHTPPEDIRQELDPFLAEAISRMRAGTIHPEPGYDGEFGVIRVFGRDELEALKGQNKLFSFAATPSGYRSSEQMPLPFTTGEKSASQPETPATNRLNNEQQQVLSASGGARLVVAGPGTGKTRTLTAWLQQLVEKNLCRPEEVLAITFTNKAALEMQYRLEQNLQARARAMRIATFHAFCYELIQERYPELTTIYDEQARLAILKVLIPEASALQLKKQSHLIEQLYEGTLSPPLTAGAADTPVVSPADYPVFEKYKAALRDLNGLDLAEIITRVNLLFSSEPEFKQKIQSRYRYVAVDEFQDINRAQYTFLAHLLQQNPEVPANFQPPSGVLVIGDPDQAIYGFRGADVNLFFSFQQDYKAERCSLVRNYRSNACLVEAASALIAQNKLSSRLALEAEQAPGKKIQYYQAQDDLDEAHFIATTIEKLLGGTSHRTIAGFRSAHDYDESLEKAYSFSSFAILFRTRSIRDSYVKYLSDAGIPTHIQDNVSFFAEQPFALALNLLKLIHNPRDLVALHQVAQCETLLNLPWGPLADDGRVKAALSHPSGTAGTDSESQQAAPGLMARALAEPVQKIQHLLAPLITDLNDRLTAAGLPAVLTAIFTRYLKLDESNPEMKQKYSLLLEMSATYGQELALFLKQVALSPLENEGLPQAEKVSLYTFHAAKGLEFPVVFIVAAEEGITPILNRRTEIETEEERRLFYVALTRARDVLFISSARERKIFGVRQQQRPSRFLGELPSDLVETVTLKKTRENKAAATHEQLQLF